MNENITLIESSPTCIFTQRLLLHENRATKFSEIVHFLLLEWAYFNDYSKEKYSIKNEKLMRFDNFRKPFIFHKKLQYPINKRTISTQINSKVVTFA